MAAFKHDDPDQSAAAFAARRERLTHRPSGVEGTGEALAAAAARLLPSDDRWAVSGEGVHTWDELIGARS
jgi:hypothetical protein